MKLKKIEALIKKSKAVSIVETDGAYWIGTGKAMYPTYFNHLDTDVLMMMFDLDEEKRESITEVPSELMARACIEDHCEEALLQRGGIRVMYGGHCLIPMYQGARVLFVDERHLAPLTDIKEGVECYVRIGGGRPYIAVKSGMLLVGLIEPEEIIDETYIAAVKEMYERCQATYEANAPTDTYRQEVIG